jgi:hypothetical protein
LKIPIIGIVNVLGLESAQEALGDAVLGRLAFIDILIHTPTVSSMSV